MAGRMTARACTIGVDLGTTTLKAIAFDDASGHPIARAAAHVALLGGVDAADSAVGADERGVAPRAEQDPDAVAVAATELLAQVVTDARARNYTVARVGLSAAMH